MDYIAYNRESWNRQVSQGNRWSRPVDGEAVAQARAGVWQIFLTPTRPLPRQWLGEVRGKDVLCLASGGGQQGPILAAAGARVTVFDLSDAQLAQDLRVAEREGLDLRTVQGDMRDLSCLEDASFDVIVHPVSNVFVDDLDPVWREAFRVLRPGGRLCAGFMNPVFYLFDWELQAQGQLTVRYPLPYSDLDAGYDPQGAPLEFSHTLEAQLDGQMRAGFVLVGFYEDVNDPPRLLDAYTSSFLATCAVKP